MPVRLALVLKLAAVVVRMFVEPREAVTVTGWPVSVVVERECRHRHHHRHRAQRGEAACESLTGALIGRPASKHEASESTQSPIALLLLQKLLYCCN